MIMNAHILINQDSEDCERYTPSYIVDAARKVMGPIDLDPASSSMANETIMATTFFTREDDGLDKDWFGNVWMNHPFSRGEKACIKNCKKKKCITRGHIESDIPSNSDWINKLVESYQSGLVDQAMCICFASTSEAWFRPLHEFPQCFLYGRTNFAHPNGKKQSGATKGSVVTYLGQNIALFFREFHEFGSVKIPACIAIKHLEQLRQLEPTCAKQM